MTRTRMTAHRPTTAPAADDRTALVDLERLQRRDPLALGRGDGARRRRRTTVLRRLVRRRP